MNNTTEYSIKKEFRHRFRNKHTKTEAEMIDKIYEGDKLTHYVLQDMVKSKTWPSWRESLRRKINVTPEELKEHWIEITNYE